MSFFHTDIVKALIRSYQENCHPVQYCNAAGCHSSAILLFILHVSAGVDFDGNLLSANHLDQQIDQSNLSGNGSSLIWNSLQIVEGILLAFTGNDSSTPRYLSVQLGLFIVKLDDNCIHSFFKLLLSRNSAIHKNFAPWEEFFGRSGGAFNELCSSEVAKHAISTLANLSDAQSALVDSIYRGDSPAFHKIILRNPSINLDPRNSDLFGNQCYVAAIEGNQEHILEDLVQKGFKYSQQFGEESLLFYQTNASLC